MKKILFCINNMNVGGIQKSLVELLKLLAEDNEYKISLYCIKNGGLLMSEIPKNIEILYGDEIIKISESSLKECYKMGKFYFFMRAFFSTWSKFFGKRIPVFIITKMMRKIEGEYDVAISFTQPIDDKKFFCLSNEIVLKCCSSKTKATFVHCDFKVYGGNTKYNRSLYKKFDKIAVVSKSVGKQLIKCMPYVENKTHVVENYCDSNLIKKMADINPINYNKITIVTVARLSEEKGILRCIPIFKKIIDDGFFVEWHIVGDGPLKKEINDSIIENKLEKIIYLHGEQSNPYRFMKNANFFFLPSYHEAAPLVFSEALVFKLPILTTKTLSAIEMIKDRDVGLVCENNEDGIYKILKNALINGFDKINDINSDLEKRKVGEQFAELCKISRESC